MVIKATTEAGEAKTPPIVAEVEDPLALIPFHHSCHKPSTLSLHLSLDLKADLRDQHAKFVGRQAIMPLIAIIGWTLPIKERIHLQSLQQWQVPQTSNTLKILRLGSLIQEHLITSQQMFPTSTPQHLTKDLIKSLQVIARVSQSKA